MYWLTKDLYFEIVQLCSLHFSQICLGPMLTASALILSLSSLKCRSCPGERTRGSMYYRSAAQRCLALPEIIHEIGTYLPSADDLLDASCVNRQWKEVLVPLRAHFPHVYLRDLPSFLLFLKSNPRAGHSCHGLRVSVCCGLRLRGLTADTLLRSSLMKIIGMEMTPF